MKERGRMNGGVCLRLNEDKCVCVFGGGRGGGEKGRERGRYNIIYIL